MLCLRWFLMNKKRVNMANVLWLSGHYGVLTIGFEIKQEMELDILMDCHLYFMILKSFNCFLTPLLSGNNFSHVYHLITRWSFYCSKCAGVILQCTFLFNWKLEMYFQLFLYHCANLVCFSMDFAIVFAFNLYAVLIKRIYN